MKKILVFGGNGFVGRYVCKEFFENNYYVIANGRNICKDALKSYINEYHQVDIISGSEVASEIKNILPEYIINLAAVSSVGDSWAIPTATIQANVVGSLNILEAVRKYSTQTKILLIGSSEEYKVSESKISEDYPINANNPYGISKVTQEKFAELYRSEYGLDIICTRTFNYTGPGQTDKFVIPSFVNQVAQLHNDGMDGILKVGNLNVMRDIGDVRDMAYAYRLILEENSDKRVINVGSGNCYLLRDLLDYIIGIARVKIEIEIDPSKIRPIDNHIIWCDNSLLRREFGWNPRYTVYDAMGEMFKQYGKRSKI